MTTYPNPSDPVSALSRADGSTKAHSDDHGRIIDHAISWKKYLRGDGTTESASQMAALQTAIQGKHSYIPPGTYKFPDGVGIVVSTTNTHIEGAGDTLVQITVNGAYAISSTAGTNNVQVEGFYVAVRGGVTGGGVKLVDTANSIIYDVHAENSGGASTQPMIYLNGSVASHIDLCHGLGSGGAGIKLDAGASFNNANTVKRSRAAGNGYTDHTAGGIHVEGGGGNRIRDNVSESNSGRGIVISGSVMCTVEGNWFEGNYRNNLEAGSITLVQGNKFHYQIAGDATAVHILAGPYDTIICNEFQDASNSGTTIDGQSSPNLTIFNNYKGSINDGDIINVDGAGTFIAGGYTGGTISAGGLGTVTDGDYIDIPGAARSLRVMGSSLLGDDTEPFKTGILVATGSGGAGGLFVRRSGHVMFASGAASSADMPTGVWEFYWDNANAQIRARIRKNDASYATQVVSGPQSSAYTVTNPTTDRALNVTADTLPQVAEVLGTLIADLQAAGILG